MSIKAPVRAVVLGGSGNVGSCIVNSLINLPETEKVTLVSRRPLPEVEAKSEKINVRVVNYAAIAAESFEGHNVAFNALGCGAASKVSKETLMEVDATTPVAFAQACKTSGVGHFSSLSAIGADSSQEYSRITRCAMPQSIVITNPTFLAHFACTLSR